MAHPTRKEIAMVTKRPICPHRIRTIPPQFSWIDHRLVRDGHIDSLSHAAAALYLFLATVADAQGLSYYSDRTLCRRLALSEDSLENARAQLLQFDLVAYQKPLVQVLALEPRSDPPPDPWPTPRMTPADRPLPIKDIFQQIRQVLS
jgi:hypothetical protein